jgi:hypothetical protein
MGTAPTVDLGTSELVEEGHPSLMEEAMDRVFASGLGLIPESGAPTFLACRTGDWVGKAGTWRERLTLEWL